jgi:hypothetical protein
MPMNHLYRIVEKKQQNGGWQSDQIRFVCIALDFEIEACKRNIANFCIGKTATIQHYLCNESNCKNDFNVKDKDLPLCILVTQ